jgi:hypothetical protein
MNSFKFVRSKYRSKWKGIVLSTYDIRGSYPKSYKGIGYNVLIIKDKNGNTPNRRIIRSLNKDWFEEIEPFDINHINKDWYK